jgi:hypothetical protein
MRMTVYAAMMVIVVSVVAGTGCNVPLSGEELGTVTEEIQSAEPAERPARLLPLRSEDLVDMAEMQVQLAAACPAPKTCAGFGSCAAWSTTTSCGSAACGQQCFRCVRPSDPICHSGITRSTFTSRFRVCFNAQQQSCTEFQVFTASSCQLFGSCCDQNPGVCGEEL